MPPALTRTSLRSAISSGCVQTLSELLLRDGTLVHVPVTTQAGCEPPTVAAIRMGCCAPVLEVLLHHGAASTARGRCGASALHILVSPVQSQNGSGTLLSWTDIQAEGHLPTFAGILQGLPCAGFHEAGKLLFQEGVAAAAAFPLLPMSWNNTEQRRCALAACLLRHGVDATEEWKGVMPAEAARLSGQLRLANVVEHFDTWRVQRILAKHRSVASGTKSSGSPFLEGDANVYALISEYLAPLQGESGVQTNCTTHAR